MLFSFYPAIHHCSGHYFWCCVCTLLQPCCKYDSVIGHWSSWAQMYPNFNVCTNFLYTQEEQLVSGRAVARVDCCCSRSGPADNGAPKHPYVRLTNLTTWIRSFSSIWHAYFLSNIIFVSIQECTFSTRLLSIVHAVQTISSFSMQVAWGPFTITCFVHYSYSNNSAGCLCITSSPKPCPRPKVQIP